MLHRIQVDPPSKLRSSCSVAAKVMPMPVKVAAVSTPVVTAVLVSANCSGTGVLSDGTAVGLADSRMSPGVPGLPLAGATSASSTVTTVVPAGIVTPSALEGTVTVAPTNELTLDPGGRN